MLSIGGTTIHRELLAAKSEKIAGLLKQNPNVDLSTLLHNASDQDHDNAGIPPAEPEIFELIARFCHGYHVNLSSNNIIPVICMSYYLRMTDDHCRNNLLNKAALYFEKRILASWNETVESLGTLRSECLFRQAVDIGVMDVCLESIAGQALVNPVLVFGRGVDMDYYLGVVGGGRDSEIAGEVICRPNAKRRLFGSGGGILKSELSYKEVEGEEEEEIDDLGLLSSLPVCVYEYIIHGLIRRGFQPKYIAASLIQYLYEGTSFVYVEDDDEEETECVHRALAKRRAYIQIRKRIRGGDRPDADDSQTEIDDHQSQRQVIESVERLLPTTDQAHENHTTLLLPCKLLCQILRFAVSLKAGPDCQNGLEIRIGKRLENATVQDLLLVSLLVPNSHPSDDVDRLKRILKCFYGNFRSPDPSGMILVAERMEDLLTVVAGERELEMDPFVAFVDLTKSALMARRSRGAPLVAADGGGGDDGGALDGIYGAVDVYLDTHPELTEVEKEYVCKVLDFSKLSDEACHHAAQNRRLPLRVIVQVLFLTQLRLRDAISTERDMSKPFVDERGGRLTKNMDEDNGSHEEGEEEERRKLIPETGERRGLGKEKGSLWKQVKRKFGCINGTQYGRIGSSSADKRQKAYSSSRKIIRVLHCG